MRKSLSEADFSSRLLRLLVIFCTQQDAYSTLLQEWSGKIAKSANRRHFVLSSGSTTLNGLKQH